MRIVKHGKVPSCCYRGTCYSCGCVVECTAAEVKKSKIVDCPTFGCSGKINLHLSGQPYEDNEPYIYPWMPKPLPKPYSEPRWTLQSPPMLSHEVGHIVCLRLSL